MRLISELLNLKLIHHIKDKYVIHRLKRSLFGRFPGKESIDMWIVHHDNCIHTPYHIQAAVGFAYLSSCIVRSATYDLCK